MVWLLAINQLQMQVAARFVGESLKEFPRQTEAKSTRHILIFLGFAHAFEPELVQPTPYKVGATAEIDDTSCEAFIHRDMSLTPKRVARVETGAVTANPFLVAKGLNKGLPQ